ncbi:MAG TPA: MFS transporter [Candidatus Acidoferrum sp.]|nr:MFS transporter [Candidatus Acidoferrum sp.]
MPNPNPPPNALAPAANLALPQADELSSPLPSSRAGYFRWVICALLLLGVTKNYIDRQVLGVLKTTLQHDFGWNEIQYGNLVSYFQIAYGAGMLLMGRLIDRLGTRVGYALAMAFWSLASMAHAAAGSFATFALARTALGFGEAGVFPASIKCVAEWFPKRERALATGIFNAGTNAGAIVTPLIVPWIAVHWGWRSAFLLTGALGFVWLIFWFLLYRKPEEHPRVSKAELAYIRSDPSEPTGKIGWRALFPHRQTWTFAVGKFLTDPIWWFYLFWVPDFLQRQHGLALMNIGVPIMVIYVISDIGSVAGGWLSSRLIHRGSSVNAARKITMLICALGVTPIIFAYRIESLWGAVFLIGLAAAAHQGFSANLYTLTSDMFPARAVGSVVGIGGMAGAIGGMLIAEVVGHALQWTGSYMIPFLMAGSAYLLALFLIHLLAPKLEPARIT